MQRIFFNFMYSIAFLSCKIHELCDIKYGVFCMDSFFAKSPMHDLSGVSLHLSAVSRAQLDNRWQADNVCSPFARIYVVLSGCGTLTTDRGQTLLQPGYAYLVPTGTRFSYACDSFLHKFFFHINLLGHDGLDLLQNLHEIHETKLASNIPDRLERAHNNKNLPSVLMLKSIVTELLAQLLTTYPPLSIQPEYSAAVAAAVLLIQKNIGHPPKAAEIAKGLYLSESTLHKRFKAETGLTLGQYTDHLIFFHAALLLVQTEDSVKSISDRLGFCDQFYFARRFKERTHLTPTAYRRLAKLDKLM